MPVSSNVRPHRPLSGVRPVPKTRPCALLAKPVSHSAIVADYLRRNAPRLAAELTWFAQRQSNTAALARVTAAKDMNGKRLSHQWRLLRNVSPLAFSALSAILPRLMHMRDFANLHCEIDQAMRHIHGCGPLFIYDTALRFGAFRKFLPEEVYIHAGAAAGARRVLRRTPKPTEPVSAFPPAFGALPAHELENLLCCYRECL